ncbi:hypothetical protein [Arthrobacter sp. zg-Y238]|uniref:hypothetical protein n=1 Tax=Arthrobacter sp. zg-Y238 TaxID=2964614 RepID=UPI0021046B63|nr:hypothetical protein [Arthrobacter sp. zg-Y238]MCQ1954476.1 hypothetical protein [Arthrobacter sp. zg-Y238]
MSNIRGRLWPQVVHSGQKATIRVENLPASARQVAAVISGTDNLETSWRMDCPLELVGNGSAYAQIEIPRQTRETALFVSSVWLDSERLDLPNISVCICDPIRPLGRSDPEVVARYADIQKSQYERYGVPLGDPTVPGSSHYRIACIVQGLLLTTQMRLPGIRVFGIEARPSGADAEQLVNSAIAQLGWSAQPLQPGWAEAFGRHQPVSVFAFENVFAESIELAMQICTEARDNLLSILSVNRGASGRPVVTCVEQLQDGETIASKFRFEQSTYRGNLIGGILAGENQSQLVLQQTALNHDPLLKLCLDLFREAQADPSPDARYFRLWSALETLAIGRIEAGRPVTRLDGTPWPGNLDSSKAAPRVYQLIAGRLFRSTMPIDEQSMVHPAPDLASAVTHWYARRNATAHYGRFMVGDPDQMARNWYRKALATVAPQGDPDEWLMAFERICADVLRAEMYRVGTLLVP